MIESDLDSQSLSHSILMSNMISVVREVSSEFDEIVRSVWKFNRIFNKLVVINNYIDSFLFNQNKFSIAYANFVLNSLKISSRSKSGIYWTYRLLLATLKLSDGFFI